MKNPTQWILDSFRPVCGAFEGLVSLALRLLIKLSIFYLVKDESYGWLNGATNGIDIEENAVIESLDDSICPRSRTRNS